MDKKRLLKLAGINELAGDPADWEKAEPEKSRDEKLIQGLQLALQKLDERQLDAARYYLTQMLSFLSK